MFDNSVSALADFMAQPFGVAGAICVMLAVTSINSRRLAAKLEASSSSGSAIFNCLNLVGGACLFVNATIRGEIVWVVLETYFVAVAIKGLIQLQNNKRLRRDSTTAAACEPEDHRRAAHHPKPEG